MEAIKNLSSGISAMEQHLKEMMRDKFKDIKEKIKVIEGENETRADAIIEIDHRLRSQESITKSLQNQISVLTDTIKMPERIVPKIPNKTAKVLINEKIKTANNLKWGNFTHKESIMTEARKWVGLQPIGTHHVYHFTDRVKNPSVYPDRKAPCP